MPATASPATALRYRDVTAAADWLCAAFGFEKQTVVTGEAGATVYAQLTFGRAMLMLAAVRDTPLDKFMKQPDEVGGAETQSCYFVVADADAHYALAKASGAEIILDMQDDDFGGRGYTCRDPEGHIWTFGTYDPWQGKHPQPAATAVGGGMRRVALAGLVTAAIAAGAAAAWVGGALKQPSASTVQVQGPPAVAENAAGAKEPEATQHAHAELERERAAKVAAEKASQDVLKRVAEEQRGREAAERSAREVRVELDLERAAKVAADKASEDALKRVAEEQRAREAAERAVREVRAQLERERTGKAAAEMAKEFALARAEEERLAREAVERAAREPAAGERKTPAEPAAEDAVKRAAEAQLALEQAKKLAADEKRAREAAERAVLDAREQLAREQAAKNQAWKVVTQLSWQLKQVQGTSPPGEASSVGDNDAPAPASKKARPRSKQKKEPEPDQ